MIANWQDYEGIQRVGQGFRFDRNISGGDPAGLQNPPTYSVVAGEAMAVVPATVVDNRGSGDVQAVSAAAATTGEIAIPPVNLSVVSTWLPWLVLAVVLWFIWKWAK
jgi:hypothetical protein